MPKALGLLLLLSASALGKSWVEPLVGLDDLQEAKFGGEGPRDEDRMQMPIGRFFFPQRLSCKRSEAHRAEHKERHLVPERKKKKEAYQLPLH